MAIDEKWRSLRELDEAVGQPKGSAFRAFKSLLDSLVENIDFVVLDHQTQSAVAATLHASDRLYRGSINPVMLAPIAAAKVEAKMRATGSAQ